MDVSPVHALASPLGDEERWPAAHPEPQRRVRRRSLACRKKSAGGGRVGDGEGEEGRVLVDYLALGGDDAAMSERDWGEAEEEGAWDVPGAADQQAATQHDTRLNDLVRSARNKAASRSTLIAPHTPFSALELTYPPPECRQWAPSPRAIALRLLQTLGADIVQLRNLMEAPRAAPGGGRRMGLYCHEFVADVQRLIRAVERRGTARLLRQKVWSPTGLSAREVLRSLPQPAQSPLHSPKTSPRPAPPPACPLPAAPQYRASDWCCESPHQEGGAPRAGRKQGRSFFDSGGPTPSRSVSFKMAPCFGSPRGSSRADSDAGGGDASPMTPTALVGSRHRLRARPQSPTAAASGPEAPANGGGKQQRSLSILELAVNQMEPHESQSFAEARHRESGMTFEQRLKRLSSATETGRRGSGTPATDLLPDPIVPSLRKFSTIPTPHLSARSPMGRRGSLASPPASPTGPLVQGKGGAPSGSPRSPAALPSAVDTPQDPPLQKRDQDASSVRANVHMYTDTQFYNSILETEAEIVREWEGIAPDRGSCMHSIDYFGTDRMLQYSLARLYCSANVSDNVAIDWGDLNAFLIDITMQGNGRQAQAGDKLPCRKYLCSPLLEPEYNDLCHAGMKKVLYSHVSQRMVVLGGDNHCRLVDPFKLNRVIQTYPWVAAEGNTVDIAMLDVPHHVGPRLATSSSDGTVRVYDVSTASFMASESFGGMTQTCVEWGEDHSILFCGGRNGGITFLGTANTFHTCKMKKLVHIDAPGASVMDMLSLSGNQLVCGSLEPDISIVDTFRGEVVTKFVGHQKGVYSLAYSKLFNFIASSGFESTPYLWFNTTRKGRKPFRMKCNEPHMAKISKVRMVEGTPQLISLDEKGVMKVWDVRMMQEVYSVACGEPLAAAADGGAQRFVDFAYHEKTKSIVTAGGSRRAEVAKHSAPPESTRGMRKANCFYRLCFESVESYFTSQAEMVRAAAVRAENYPIVAVNVLVAHREILTAAATHANVWDAETGAFARRFGTYNDIVTAQAVSKGEERVFTGIVDGLVLIQAMNGLDIARVSLHRTPVAGVLYFEPEVLPDGARSDASPLSFPSVVGVVRRASRHAKVVRRRTRLSINSCMHTGSIDGSDDACPEPVGGAEGGPVPSILSWDTEGNLVCTSHVTAAQAEITENRVISKEKLDATCAAYSEADGALLVGCKRNVVCVWRQRKDPYGRWEWALTRQVEFFPSESDTSAITVLPKEAGLKGGSGRHQLFVSCDGSGGCHMGRSDGVGLLSWASHTPGRLAYPVVALHLSYYPQAKMLYAADKFGYTSVYSLEATLNFDADAVKRDQSGREFHPVLLRVKREEKGADHAEAPTARDSRCPLLPPSPTLVSYWRAHGQAVTGLKVLSGADATQGHLDTRVLITTGKDGAVKLWSLWGRLLGAVSRLVKDPGMNVTTQHDVDAWFGRDALWQIHCTVHNRLLPVPADELPSPANSEDERPNCMQRFPTGEGPQGGDLRGVLMFRDDVDGDGDEGSEDPRGSSTTGAFNDTANSRRGTGLSRLSGVSAKKKEQKRRSFKGMAARYMAMVRARQLSSAAAEGDVENAAVRGGHGRPSTAPLPGTGQASAFSALNKLRVLHMSARGLKDIDGSIAAALASSPRNACLELSEAVARDAARHVRVVAATAAAACMLLAAACGVRPPREGDMDSPLPPAESDAAAEADPKPACGVLWKEAAIPYELLVSLQSPPARRASAAPPAPASECDVGGEPSAAGSKTEHSELAPSSPPASDPCYGGSAAVDSGGGSGSVRTAELSPLSSPAFTGSSPGETPSPVMTPLLVPVPLGSQGTPGFPELHLTGADGHAALSHASDGAPSEDVAGTDYFKLNYGDLRRKGSPEADAKLDALASSTFVAPAKSRLASLPRSRASAVSDAGGIQLAVPAAAGTQPARPVAFQQLTVAAASPIDDAASSLFCGSSSGQLSAEGSAQQPLVSVPFDDIPAPWGCAEFGPKYGYPEAQDKLCSYVEWQPAVAGEGDHTKSPATPPVTPPPATSQEPSMSALGLTPPPPAAHPSATPRGATLLVPAGQGLRTPRAGRLAPPSPAAALRVSVGGRDAASKRCWGEGFAWSPKGRGRPAGAARPPASTSSDASLPVAPARNDSRAGFVNTAKLDPSIFARHVKKKPAPSKLTCAEQVTLGAHLRLLINNGAPPSPSRSPSPSPQQAPGPPAAAAAAAASPPVATPPLRRLPGDFSGRLRGFVSGLAAEAMQGDRGGGGGALMAELAAAAQCAPGGAPPPPTTPALLSRKEEVRQTMWDVLVTGLSTYWDRHEVSRRARDRLALTKKRPQTHVEKIHQKRTHRLSDGTGLEYPTFDACAHVRPGKRPVESPDPQAIAGGGSQHTRPPEHWLTRLVLVLKRINPALVPQTAQHLLASVEKKAKEVLGADTFDVRAALQALDLEQPPPPPPDLDDVEWFDAVMEVIPSPACRSLGRAGPPRSPHTPHSASSYSPRSDGSTRDRTAPAQGASLSDAASSRKHRRSPPIAIPTVRCSPRNGDASPAPATERPSPPPSPLSPPSLPCDELPADVLSLEPSPFHAPPGGVSSPVTEGAAAPSASISARVSYRVKRPRVPVLLITATMAFETAVAACAGAVGVAAVTAGGRPPPRGKFVSLSKRFGTGSLLDEFERRADRVGHWPVALPKGRHMGDTPSSVRLPKTLRERGAHSAAPP